MRSLSPRVVLRRVARCRPEESKRLICGIVLFVAVGIGGVVFTFLMMRHKAFPEPTFPRENTEEIVLNRKISKYMGIPYAVQMTKRWRFSAPQQLYFSRRHVNRTGSFSRLGCPQPLSVPFPRRHISQSNSEDDCLYLNIWQPSEEDLRCGLKPVVVVLFGGGFQYGGGGTYTFYEGKYMASLWDVVVVVPAYRVGVFGFLNAGIAVAPGNVGIRDQLVALKWVKQNIHNFGGSSSDVTILGHEAGATSVGFHLLLSHASLLFHRAIMISGSPYAFIRNNTKNATVNVQNLAAGLKCKAADGPGKMHSLVACLRTRPVKSILEAVDRRKLYFGPSCDNKVVVLSRGLRDQLITSMKPVDIIIGYTTNEGSHYVAEFLNFFGLSSRPKLKGGDILSPLYEWLYLYGVQDPSTVIDFYNMSTPEFEREEGTALLSFLESLFGDMLVHCPVNYFIERATQVGSRVFAYVFAHLPYYRWWKTWKGVPQMLDLIYATGQVHVIEKDFGLAQEELWFSVDMAKMFAGFAWNANPNVLPSTTWLRWEKARESVLEFKLSRNATRMYTSLSQLPHEEYCKFWIQYLSANSKA
ncbi:cholinesterase 1-like [Ornithodoros turicata]|uniref:cholinesterase 1-like n=1 Tax=Ornithodoros turicata TaxID=34597 RepID=UPI00313930F5